MTDFIKITEDGGYITSLMPPDETEVEVTLRNGTVVRAYYSQNIQESGDWDFIPMGSDGEPDIEGNSLAASVVSWRFLHG